MHMHQGVRIKQLAGGVTSDTTSNATDVHTTGFKTFFGVVSGTGAVAQTQKIYGNYTGSNSGGVLLATITLSGTTSASDAAATSTAPYAYYYVITTGTSGTGATGNVYVMY